MPSFGRKRLGLASTARQAGEGHTSIDSTVSVRALPGGLFICRSRRRRGGQTGARPDAVPSYHSLPDERGSMSKKGGCSR